MIKKQDTLMLLRSNINSDSMCEMSTSCFYARLWPFAEGQFCCINWVLVWSVVSYGSETWTLRQEDIRGLWDVDLATYDEDSLDTACIKWADIRNGGWKSLLDGKFEKKTEKLEWACLKTQLPITEGHRRKVSRKENSWKTKNNVIGCIDARRWREWDWLCKAERKSTWQRNLASMRKNLPLGRKHQQTIGSSLPKCWAAGSGV